jgi:hypothetical protein
VHRCDASENHEKLAQAVHFSVLLAFNSSSQTANHFSDPPCSDSWDRFDIPDFLSLFSE